MAQTRARGKSPASTSDRKAVNVNVGGGLREHLADRVPEGSGLSAKARRDLLRYYGIIEAESATLQAAGFTEAKVKTLAHILAKERAVVEREPDLFDVIVERECSKYPNAKFPDLATDVRKLRPGARYALIDAIERHHLMSLAQGGTRS